MSAMLLRQLTFDRSQPSLTRKAGLHADVIHTMEQPDLPDELLLTLGSVRDFVPLLDPEGLKRLSDQIVEVASRRRDLAVLANGWWAGAWAALERADRSDWDACVAEYDKVSADLSLAVELSSAASMRCVTAQIEGQLEEAGGTPRKPLPMLAPSTIRQPRSSTSPELCCWAWMPARPAASWRR